ncbi:MAG: hypothetical protein EPO32_01885 [Anaerolineae bacterium]|nr:MAG: hypothetical protein EPO32_01885 [Anaerolineae bacterium]
MQKTLPPEWLGILEELKRIMEELPPEGGRRLFELWKQVPGNLKQGQARTALDELRSVLIRVSENWERYTAFFHDPGIPWTNNATEQAIGRMKMRAKSVRGYKTTSGRLNGLLVSSSTLT